MYGNEVYIDISLMYDEADIHALLSSRLRFPAYYGNNLSALNDCLEDIAQPTDIIVDESGGCPASLQEWLPKFYKVLQRCAEHNDMLSVAITTI